MQINIIGSNIEVGKSLTTYVEENLEKAVTKYFENAVSADVHFSKDGNLFKTLIIVNEGVKGGGIVVKSDAQAGDVYGSFNEACEKAAKQLRRYKKKIKSYRRHKGGIKSATVNQIAVDAMKYVLPPEKYDVFEEMDSDVEEEKAPALTKDLNVIAEKNTVIEELSVEDAIMKMDLANLPALVFTNSENKTSRKKEQLSLMRNKLTIL